MMTVAVRGWSASSGSIRPLVAAWWMGGTDGAMSGRELESNVRSAASPLGPRQLRGPAGASPSGPPDSAVECSPGDAGSALAWAVDPARESDYLASAVPMTFAAT